MPATPRCTSAAIAIAVLALALPAGALAKDDGFSTTSSTTYTLLPDEAKVHVESTITLLNKRKPTTRRGPCEKNPRKTCKVTTTYWIESWTSWYPAAVDGFAVTGRGVTTSALSESASGTFYRADLPKVSKKKQKLKVSYDLPGAPAGSAQPTRVTDGYAHFCWTGEAATTGTTRAIVPAGWDTLTTLAPTTSEADASGTTITATARKAPFHIYACTDAFRTDALERIYILGPSDQVVTVDSWLTDPTWRETMLDVIGVDLPALEELIGSPMPFAALTVTEVARTNPYDMRSDIRPAEGRLFIDEDLDMMGVPTVALARTWFNASTLAEPWLEQGLSMWAGLTVADASCPDPGVAPESAAAGLSDWAEPAGKPPAWDGGRLYYQTAAACTAVERLAEAVGPAGMASALSAFLSAAPTYGSVARTPRDADGRADWRDFLDAIDEVGLIPAAEPDLELAERLLVEYGIADAAALSGRASARQIYHDTLASMDGTAMPAYVDTLMGDWAFGDALAGVIDAGRVYRAIAASASPGEAERDAFLGAFTSAASPEALEAIEQAVAAAAS